MGQFADKAPAILDKYGLRGPLIERPGGKVCEAYFTADVVLKIPRKRFVHTAKWEASAGPVAFEAGIRTAPLLAFDESHDLIDRPFTIWKRLDGGHPETASPVWRQVGREIAALHERVRGLDHLRPPPDSAPLAYLQRPAVRSYLAAKGVFRDISQWAARLAGVRVQPCGNRFLHGDAHALNVLCSPEGDLIALLDWGNAGWGDPAYDLARVPCPALPAVLEGYESIAGAILGDHVRGRILGLRLARILRWADGGAEEPGDLIALLQFARRGPPEWRRYG